MTDDKVGMEVQCTGLAAALGLTPVVKRIANRLPWRWMPPSLAVGALRAPGPKGDRLSPPWPDLLIASGRQSVAPSVAVRKASGGKTFLVQIQDPKLTPTAFDMVVVPEHDRVRGENVVTTRGSMNGITAERLNAAAKEFAAGVSHLPQKRVAILIGGPNKVYRYTSAFARDLGSALSSASVQQEIGLLITPSRRTPSDFLEVLKQQLDAAAYVIWDGSDPNPYHGYLGLADSVVVTADSVNMVTEACTTGKPVQIAEPTRARESGGKFNIFHTAMSDAGFTRPFVDRIEHWSFEPPRETQRVAGLIADALRARGFQLTPS
ncbi:MAG: mitochondrial fission ELM1 family protein [Pseudomonadota bacterium]